MNVTIFKDVLNVSEPHIVHIDAILGAIKNGKYKEQVEAIRKSGANEKRELKAKLPCVLYCGEFLNGVEKVDKNNQPYTSFRDDRSLKKHSSLVPIDIDGLVDVEFEKEELKKLPYVYALWTSPSGTGIHGLVKIGDPNKHSEHYGALLNTIKDLDPSARNPSRILYVSYDPEIYVNPSCDTFYDVVIEKQREAVISTGDGCTDYKKVDIACRMVRNAPDGQKHHSLNKAAYLLGGFIATKTVEFDVAYNALRHEISKRDIKDLRHAEKTIADGLTAGQYMPISAVEAEYREALEVVGENELEFLTDNDKDEDYIHRFRLGLIPQGLPFGYDRLDEHFLLKEGEFYAVLGHSHIGKAQPLSSKVLTPSGWKKMGELRIGDSIVGLDGNEQNVVGIFPQGQREVYKVTISDGSHVLCDKEHLWSVNRYTRRHNGTRDANGINRYDPDNTFETLKLSDMIGKVKIKGERSNGINNFMLPPISSVNFINRPVPLDAYLLGLILGDGCITDKRWATVTTSDKSIADYVYESEHGCYIHKKESDGRATVYTARIKVNACYALESMGLLGTRSDTKFIPEQYLYNSIDVRFAILQGLMDTDGSVDKLGSMSYSTTSEKLKDGIVELVNSFGGRCMVKLLHKKYTHNGIKKDGKPCYTVSIKLPPWMIPFRLQRHIDKLKPNRRPVRKYIQSIEYHGVEECQCIMVSNPDKLYITDNYTPTHNSTWTLWMLFLSSFKYDWNWMVYCGENSPASVKIKLMQFFYGKRIQKFDETQQKAALKFVDDHFFILSSNNIYTYREILDHAVKLMGHKSLKGVFIDPYNSLKIDLGKTESKYTYDYEAYSAMLTFTKKYNTTLFLSVHTTTGAQRDKDAQGNQTMPHATDAEGGSALYNRCDNFVTIHRKIKDDNEFMFTHVSIDKVRNDDTGGRPTPRSEPVVMRMLDKVEFTDEQGLSALNRFDMIAKYEYKV